MATERGDEKKRDHGKPMWDLLPWKQVGHIVDVLTFGAKKYGPNQWRTVDNAIDRYFAAAMRHIVAWKTGSTFDKESNLRHLAHAGCDLLFISWLEDSRIEDVKQADFDFQKVLVSSDTNNGSQAPVDVAGSIIPMCENQMEEVPFSVESYAGQFVGQAFTAEMARMIGVEAGRRAKLIALENSQK